MICRITGEVIRVTEDIAEIELGGIAYDVLIPAAAATELQGMLGQRVQLFTIQYLEGNPAGANLTPRLVGFRHENDRAFFNLITRVRGISIRKALRAMAVPTSQLAAAIQQGDARVLTSLPEIGKKTATQMISELREHVQPFLVGEPPPAPMAELNDAQRLAVDIIIGWGDRRADAERWVGEAVEMDDALVEPDEIVRAAYQIKARYAK